MHNDHIPTHETHLKAQDCRVIAIVGEDKSERIAVSYPGKLHAPTHVAAFINSEIAGKPFAEIRMQTAFIVASTAATERYRMES